MTDLILSQLEIEKYAATAIIAKGKQKVRVILRWEKDVKQPRLTELKAMLFTYGESKMDQHEAIS